ncbi:MAG: T9SS type A sorting domain-containing protein [Cytophagales bacterium]|nr:T9SS type A sorting domain-containing protein [Cytophaga sp.]
MKKNALLLSALLVSTILNAATINVSIKNFTFIPASFMANVGDVIVWTNNDGSDHGVLSGVIPGAANTFSAPTIAPTKTFSYTIQAAGSYAYVCSLHGSMKGSFTVSSLTSTQSAINVIEKLYPNPVTDKIHVEANTQMDKVNLFDVSGTLIKSWNESGTKAELNLSKFPDGIYYIAFYYKEMLLDTRKIIKE